jgi:cytochrome P450 / NADPH-cytochrome P450 reductase
MEQVGRLKYTEMIIKEILRMYPPVPAVAKALTQQEELEFRDPENPSTTKTGLTEPKAARIAINIYSLHHNKIYWGDDADKFLPERWSPEAVAARSQKNGAANAFTWLPFSFGSRACIGMQFALLEAKIVLSMLFRQYVFRLSPNAKVTMQTTPSLTLRPENLFMRIHARLPRTAGSTGSSAGVPPPTQATAQPEMPPVKSVEAKLNLLVLFGSNTGTCEDVGLKLAHTVESALRGSKVVAFKPLNQGMELLQKHNGPEDAVLVITATYNGQPPDNANHFNRWLDETKKTNPAALKGVKFAVMGVGNSQWVTFQAFPRKVDNGLEVLGAERYMGRGELDMDSSSWEDDMVKWRTGWIAQLIHTFVGDQVNAADVIRASASLPLPPSAYSAAFVDSPAEAHTIAPGAQNWKILSRKELQSRDSDRRTVHIELELPSGVSYGAGDHLGVCPRNNALVVQALAARLGFKLHQSVVLTAARAQSSAGVSLPVGSPISLKEILTYYVDITSSPSMSALAVLADAATDASEKSVLERLAGADPDEYKKRVTGQWKTILELLIEFPSVKLTLDRFLDAVPRMQPRFYSISSSPLENPKSLTITVGVSQSVSPAGRVVDGVCSTFLGVVDPTLDTLVAYVRDLNNKAAPFHLPKDTNTPIILIGAGTGLAPFRGFLQERRALKNSGATLGKAILFFGCRHPSEDYLYGEELEQFKAEGILSDLCVAFSRKSATQKVYCQDILTSHGEDIWHLVAELGARVYVCGSAGGLAKGVRAALHKIAVQYGHRSSDLADRWIAALEETGAYVQDVWG